MNKKMWIILILLFSLSGCVQESAWKEVCDYEKEPYKPEIKNIYSDKGTTTILLYATSGWELIEKDCKIVPNHDRCTYDNPCL